MQKAIELFEQIEDIDENPYHKTRTIIFDRNDMAFIKEAREELETLQQPKGCEGCIDAIFPLPKTCSNCERGKADLYRVKEQ